MMLKRANTTPIYIASPEAQPPAPKTRHWVSRFLYVTLFLASLSVPAYFYISYLLTPPSSFPLKTEFVIPEGATTVAITESLYTQGFIRSPEVMYLLLVLFHDPRELKASTYIFSQPLGMFELAERLTLGDYGNDLVRFIHYEGESRKLLAERAATVLRDFDPKEFLRITEGQEGKLFPDTYLLPKKYTAAELATLLFETYESRISPLRPAILSSELSEDEIITLASILEREANSLESKRIVAGILLRRLSMNMPLQTDASVEYVLDKPLSKLTPEDLRQDSPYNTYTNVGLPPTPIGNPGLAAIQAVLEPASSTYLFYITGNDGNFYYANTYEQHKVNIDRHLR